MDVRDLDARQSPTSPGTKSDEGRRGHLPSTADEMLARHPLPAAITEHGRAVIALAYTDVDADPSELWPIVSDSARINEAAGLKPMRVREQDGLVHGERRYGGLHQQFVELPWEWAQGSWAAVTREYSRGPVRAGRDLKGVEPGPGGGSRIYVLQSYVPRHWLGALILRAFLPSVARRLCGALERLASTVRAPPRRAPKAAAPPGAAARIAAAVARLDHVPEARVAALVEHIETSDGLALDRIRPLELAAHWQDAPDEIVRVCLHATRAGLLELSWDIVCPHCRGVRRRAASLGDVSRTQRCEPCALEFGTDAPQAVEITFQPHEAIRPREIVLYCTAAPARRRHVAVQQVVAPGERREVTARLSPGRYQLRVVGREGAQPVRVDPGAQAPLAWRASADTDGSGADIRASPLGGISLYNDTETPQTFVLEDVDPEAHALRPGRLFNHPEFRDLFSEEYLATGVHLHVGEQTVLFTDVVGSTAFYAQRGDPDAFVAVVRHFEEIEDEVREHGGAMIKTIGDAAMAAFAEPARAVACAAAILVRFSGDRADTPIRVRASLNRGSCIAVRLNSNVDYFGTTVNLAAKLQALAGACQLAMSLAVLDAPGVRAFIDQRGGPLAETRLEGAPGGPITVYRWEPGSARPGDDTPA